MGKGKRLGRALSVEYISTVAAVMLSVCKTKSGPAAHAYVGIDPFRGLANYQLRMKGRASAGTHRVAIEHAT